MPLVCDHCDAEFEPVPGEDPPRCPKCLRRHGVRSAADEPEAVSVGGAGTAKGHLWLFAICAAALFGVGDLAINGPGAFGSKGDKGAPKDPVAAAAARAKSMASLQSAEKALASGDLKEAYNQASAVLEQEPKNPQAREVMGDTLTKSGAAAEAVKEYEAALSIEPTGARHFKAGKALVSSGDPRKAVLHLKKAIELEPGAAWVNEVRKLLADLGEAIGDGPAGGGGETDDGGEGGPGSPGGASGGAPSPP